MGLHNTYHCLCGSIGEECSTIDLWFFALLQTLSLHINFKVRIEDFFFKIQGQIKGDYDNV